MSAVITDRRVLPGSRFPLGATPDGEGTNFALFSENATEVELCLFDDREARVESERLRLREVTAHIWHGYVPGLTAPASSTATASSDRIGRPTASASTPSKLLIDPNAKAIAGKVDWRAPVFGYRLGDSRDDLARSTGRYDAWGVPKGVVVDPRFEWGDDAPAGPVPWHRSIIYELHVKGVTARHPDVPDGAARHLRRHGLTAGDFDHLKTLGVTAVELLPVHDFLDDRRLVDMGLRSYWGYNTINYFAPDAALLLVRRPRRPGHRVQADGQAVHVAGTSRSSSTSSTTTPPRATTSARRSASRASTTRPITGSSRTIRASTSTTPGPATA